LCHSCKWVNRNCITIDACLNIHDINYYPPIPFATKVKKTKTSFSEIMGPSVQILELIILHIGVDCAITIRFYDELQLSLVSQKLSFKMSNLNNLNI
jgi:hypothetical protein